MSSHRATSSASQNGGEPVPFSRPPGHTHYQLLELTPEASAAELRQAFRSLSKRYHPDTTSLPAAEAREAFTRLLQAYAVLADPDSRRSYDASLRRPSPLPLVMPARMPAASARPVGVRRSLSGGEWFALVLLALALALSLLLGVGLAWARGVALVTPPSWWIEAAPVPAAAQASASVTVLPPQPGAPDASASPVPSGPAQQGGISQAP